jgi:sec-independent protein translocase protein TatA
MPEGLLSPVHLIILFAILVLLFGAKRLPDLGKGIGSGIREFRGAVNSISDGSTAEQPPASPSAATPPAGESTTGSD